MPNYSFFYEHHHSHHPEVSRFDKKILKKMIVFGSYLNCIKLKPFNSKTISGYKCLEYICEISLKLNHPTVHQTQFSTFFDSIVRGVHKKIFF